jgi:hypothetical protein
MNVGAGRVTGVASVTDHVALVNNLAGDNVDTAEMGIKCLVSITMIDHN